MKKQNDYLRFWKNYSEENGTINSCLVSFLSKVKEQQNKDEFNSFVVAFVGNRSNKEINKICYDAIKEFTKFGQKYTRTTTDKNGCKTEKEYTYKCSEFKIFQYFYSLFKVWLKEQKNK